MVDLDTFGEPACRTSDCPAEFQLEQFHLGELSPMARRSVEVSIERCPECAQRLELIRSGFDAIPSINADQMLARIHQETAGDVLPAAIVDALHAEGDAGARERSSVFSWFRMPVVIPTLIAAAAILVWVNIPQTSIDDPTPELGTRVKGTATLNVFRLRGDTVTAVGSGERFSAGDRLRFELKSRRGGHLLIVGREASGQTYVAYPLGGEESAAVKSGMQAIPGALELDESLGSESLFGILCAEPFHLDRVHWRGGEPQPIAGCQQLPFKLNKVAR